MHEEVMRMNAREPIPVNVPFCLEWEGPLDTDLLNIAVSSLVRRHAAFRTALTPNPDVRSTEREISLRVFASCRLITPRLYHQMVIEEVDQPPIPVVNVKELTHLEAAVQELVRGDVNQSFDYARPPLLRGRLLRTTAQRHLLILVAPMLICDLWSMRVLHLELARLYDEASNPALPRSAAPVSQFHQFVSWQYEYAYAGRFNSDIAFWRQQWENCELSQVWRRNFPFSKTGSTSGCAGTERFQLTPERSRRIRAYADNAQVDVRSVVLACFAGWLGGVTNKSRVALNIACRNRSPEYVGTIGWFSNQHLIGLDIPPESPGVEIALQAHATLAAAEKHQAVPPAVLWRDLGRMPEQGDTRVFFTFIPAIGSPPVLTQEGIIVRPRPMPELHGLRSPAGLSFAAIDQEEGLSLSANYSLDQFRSEDMHRMMTEIGGMLCSVVDHPESPLLRLRAARLHD